MSRRCDLTDKRHQCGHKISHAQNKSNRRFKVNLQPVSFRSEILKKDFSLHVATSTLRSVDFHGGLDAFLLRTHAVKLTEEFAKIRRQVKKAQMATNVAA